MPLDLSCLISLWLYLTDAGRKHFPPGTVPCWYDDRYCWVTTCTGGRNPVLRNTRGILQLMEELCPCPTMTHALFSTSLSLCSLLAISNHHQCSNIQKSLTLKWKFSICKARSRSALWTRWVYYSSTLGMCLVHTVPVQGVCFHSVVVLFCNRNTFIVFFGRYSELLISHNPWLFFSRIFTNNPTLVSFRPPGCFVGSRYVLRMSLDT